MEGVEPLKEILLLIWFLIQRRGENRMNESIKDKLKHTISKSCKGRFCGMCKDKEATHKVGEELNRDTRGLRHNFTQYVCCACFRDIFGGFAGKFCLKDK